MDQVESVCYKQFRGIIDWYKNYLPEWSFTWVFLIFASIAQFFSWFSGKYFFPNVPVHKRVIYLWLIALIQYVFLIIGIGASSEVLEHDLVNLNLIIHVVQIFIFFIVNRMTIKEPINKKHLIATVLIFIAIFIVVKMD